MNGMFYARLRRLLTLAVFGWIASVVTPAFAMALNSGAPADDPAAMPETPVSASATSLSDTGTAAGIFSDGSPNANAAVSLSATNILSVSPSFVPVSLKLESGETLRYELTVNGISIGQCVMEVRAKRRLGKSESNPEIYDVRCSLRSSRMAEVINGRIRTDISSFIDVKYGYSRLYLIKREEEKRTASERIEYRDEKGVAYAVFGEPNSNPEVKRYGERIALGKAGDPTSGACDPFSALYYLRARHDLAGANEIDIPVLSSRTIWPARIIVMDQRTVDVPGLGARRGIVLEVRSYCDGPVSRKGRVTLVLDAVTRVPLEISMDTPIGHGRAVLSGFENSPLNR